MFIYKKYEKPAGNNKLALLTVFAGDGDFTKMTGWGMEVLVWSSFRTANQTWFRNIERCKQQVTSLLGKIIQYLCHLRDEKLESLLI